MIKILTVDDDKQNREMLQLLMEKQGYEAIAVANGAEALEKARCNPPDMIISDIFMPVMDGYTLCRECRKDELLKDIPFIFYTGTYMDQKAEELASNMGVQRFIRKPADCKTILATVEGVLEDCRAERQPNLSAQTRSQEDILSDYAGILLRKLEEKVAKLERTNRKLERSEHHFRSILEMSADAIVSVNSEQNITIWSAGAEHLLGYTKEDIIGKSVEFIIPEQERATAKKMMDEVSGKGLVRNWETQRLTKDGQVVDVEMSVTNLGAEIGTTGIMHDISQRKIRDIERQRSFETLQKAFEGTIHAMALTVERRDPYTAGHQRRVADLAVAIAREMGLADSAIAGIGMAGVIHDLGKINIPAEILSKPTKLSNMEFDLIKTHSQTGYEILKEVKFPWPIAQIVFQHHERVNGSGYPQRLSGEDIIPEARIVAVADVVEAIASRRPYRAALGIEVALGEIREKKGLLYDANAVNACLSLFEAKRFEFIT